MKRALPLLLIGAMPISGCVAVAAFPAAGAAVIKKTQDNKRKADRKKREAATPKSGAVVMTGLKELPPPDGTTVLGNPPGPLVEPGKVPAGMQYLYGSGEAAALSYQAYLGLIDLMIAKSTDRAVGHSVFSVVLTPEATLAAPKFVPCGDRPLAVVFDVDETALLNLGYEADDSQRSGSYDQQRWERWERTGAAAVVATPGMIETARVAKASGITLVFNSNRMAANATQTEAALDGAGLGPVAHGRNLWLQGDAGSGSAKDARRAEIAGKYCVIAMAGDQLGDFSDLFNTGAPDPAQRRALASSTMIKVLWGHGWFILPNPVYGSGLKGGLDQVFPRDKRWIDPGPVAVPVAPAPPVPGAKP